MMGSDVGIDKLLISKGRWLVLPHLRQIRIELFQKRKNQNQHSSQVKELDEILR